MKKILTIMLAGFMAFTMEQTPAQAKTVDILRSVPLDISDYAETGTYPETFTSADQVLNILSGTENLLIHMETIRRSYHELPPAEQDKLLQKLFESHRASNNDTIRFFDHGYAQLVHKENKTGLFFLRKANDRIQNQFSSLAYAMAQAEVDVNEEAESPAEMTTRKLDVIFKLKDAIRIDAKEHQPGFWPSFVRVIDKLKPMAAYADFTDNDFSLTYVPYGNSIIPMRGTTSASIPLRSSTSSLLSNAETTSCNVDQTEEAVSTADTVNGKTPVSSRSLDFSSNGDVALIQFFPTEQEKLFRVLVTNREGHPMLSFMSPTYPNIVEDLEGDGTFELVVRQFRQDPFKPVIVYRLTPCGFELDKQIFSYFL